MSTLNDLMKVIDFLMEKKTPSEPVENALIRLRSEAAGELAAEQLKLLSADDIAEGMASGHVV